MFWSQGKGRDVVGVKVYGARTGDNEVMRYIGRWASHSPQGDFFHVLRRNDQDLSSYSFYFELSRPSS